MKYTPTDIIIQEISSFAVHHELNVGISDLKICADKIFDRLSGELLGIKEAARMLGVSTDMVHYLRKSGFLTGVAKNPTSQRKHWLFSLTEILELKETRNHLKNRTRKLI